MRSPHPTSSIDPREAKAEKPTFSSRLQSRMAVSKAPLWLKNATSPLRAIAPAKVALSPVAGHIIPRQLGPTIRIRAERAICSTSCSRRAPSAPASLNPAEMTMAPPTPACAHSRMTPGTVAAGVTTTARSTGSGTSPIEAQALIPRTFRRFALTGYTAPPNGLVRRFHSTVRPTLPARSVAPITATLRGAKNTSSSCRFSPRSRSAVESAAPAAGSTAGMRRILVEILDGGAELRVLGVERGEEVAGQLAAARSGTPRLARAELPQEADHSTVRVAQRSEPRGLPLGFEERREDFLLVPH